MSSFLQGIETNADVVPPEAPSYLVDIGMGRNPTSTVAPPATSIAHEASSWSGVEGRGNVADDLSLWPSVGKVGNRGASSSLMQEDVSGESSAVLVHYSMPALTLSSSRYEQFFPPRRQATW